MFDELVILTPAQVIQASNAKQLKEDKFTNFLSYLMLPIISICIIQPSVTKHNNSTHKISCSLKFNKIYL